MRNPSKTISRLAAVVSTGTSRTTGSRGGRPEWKIVLHVHLRVMPDVKPRTGALPISELIQEAGAERFDRKRAASRATRNVNECFTRAPRLLCS